MRFKKQDLIEKYGEKNGEEIYQYLLKKEREQARERYTKRTGQLKRVNEKSLETNYVVTVKIPMPKIEAAYDKQEIVIAREIMEEQAAKWQKEIRSEWKKTHKIPSIIIVTPKARKHRTTAKYSFELNQLNLNEKTRNEFKDMTERIANLENI